MYVYMYMCMCYEIEVSMYMIVYMYMCTVWATLTGFLISVGLALGVRVGIQKLGSFGLFPFTSSPLAPLALVDGVAERDGMWVVPGSMPDMLLILGAEDKLYT